MLHTNFEKKSFAYNQWIKATLLISLVVLATLVKPSFIIQLIK